MRELQASLLTRSQLADVTSSVEDFLVEELDVSKSDVLVGFVGELIQVDVIGHCAAIQGRLLDIIPRLIDALIAELSCQITQAHAPTCESKGVQLPSLPPRSPLTAPSIPPPVASPPPPAFPPPTNPFNSLQLVAGITPSLRGPLSSVNLALGAGAVQAADAYQSLSHAFRFEGAAFFRDFNGLYQHSAGASGPLHVFLQGKQYLSQQMTVPRAYATSITTIVRTASVWVDRARVRVAYQLKDALGSPLVAQPAAVTMQITLGESSVGPSACNTALTQSSGQQYVAYCSLDQLPSDWFSASAAGSASVSVALRDSTNSADVAVASGSLTIVERPAWYDSRLRSAVTGSSLAAPAGHGLESGGVFITLPVSPVYADENFDVYMYVHTAGYSLNSMTILLMFSCSHLEYVSHAQTSHFNGAVFDNSQPGRLAWVITGRCIPCSASHAMCMICGDQCEL